MSRDRNADFFKNDNDAVSLFPLSECDATCEICGTQFPVAICGIVCYQCQNRNEEKIKIKTKEESGINKPLSFIFLPRERWDKLVFQRYKQRFNL